MGVPQQRAELSPIASDQDDPASHQWMHNLPKLGWAWEFLRRDPNYRAEFSASRQSTEPGSAPTTPSSEAWSLLRFADPDQDCRQADVFWRMDACPSVLPLSSAPLASDESLPGLPLDKMRCRVSMIEEGDIHHVLFTEEGRSLQLEVRGPLTRAMLLTPALFRRQAAPDRLIAMRRLNDVVTHGVLRPQLYPPERRGARLVKVILALDGWLSGAHHREIAIRLFGAKRVATEWSNSGDHLRDQVRRAINTGRELMESGYRKLLD